MTIYQNKLCQKNKIFLWRKVKRQSSLFCTWRESMCSEYQKLQQRFIHLLVVYSLSTTGVFAAEKDDQVMFNIPRQRADLSLIRFAEQADITLLFPLDRIVGKQTNPVSGQHSIMNALQMLLKDTGLKTDTCSC